MPAACPHGSTATRSLSAPAAGLHSIRRACLWPGPPLAPPVGAPSQATTHRLAAMITKSVIVGITAETATSFDCWWILLGWRRTGALHLRRFRSGLLSRGLSPGPQCPARQPDDYCQNDDLFHEISPFFTNRPPSKHAQGTPTQHTKVALDQLPTNQHFGAVCLTCGIGTWRPIDAKSALSDVSGCRECMFSARYGIARHPKNIHRPNVLSKWSNRLFNPPAATHIPSAGIAVFGG
jgi:hypothetical protein